MNPFKTPISEETSCNSFAFIYCFQLSGPRFITDLYRVELLAQLRSAGLCKALNYEGYDGFQDRIIFKKNLREKNWAPNFFRHLEAVTEVLIM